MKSNRTEGTKKEKDLVNEKIRRSPSKNGGGGEIIASSSSATKQLHHFSIASLMATSSSTTSRVKNGNSSTTKAGRLFSTYILVFFIFGIFMDRIYFIASMMSEKIFFSYIILINIFTVSG